MSDLIPPRVIQSPGELSVEAKARIEQARLESAINWSRSPYVEIYGPITDADPVQELPELIGEVGIPVILVSSGKLRIGLSSPEHLVLLTSSPQEDFGSYARQLLFWRDIPADSLIDRPKAVLFASSYYASQQDYDVLTSAMHVPMADMDEFRVAQAPAVTSLVEAMLEAAVKFGLEVPFSNRSAIRRELEKGWLLLTPGIEAFLVANPSYDPNSQARPKRSFMNRLLGLE